MSLDLQSDGNGGPTEGSPSTAFSKVNTTRKKKCPTCDHVVGNTCKLCPHCNTKIECGRKKPRVSSSSLTNPTNQWDLLKKRAGVLHESHGCDIVILYHKKHARGHTWGSFGTPGLVEELLDEESKTGSSLKNIFRLGILNQMAHSNTNTDSDSNHDTSTTSNTHTTTNIHTNNKHNASPGSSSNTNANTSTADASINSNANTNSNPNTSSSTSTNTYTSSNTSSSTTTNTSNNTNSSTATNTSSNTSSNTNTSNNTNSAIFYTTTTTSSNTSSSTTTNARTTTDTSDNTNSTTSVNTLSSGTHENANSGKRIVLIKEGTRVGLVDNNKRVQAWGLVHNRAEIHGKILTPGYVVVEITEVLQSCNLKPICPNTFDDPDAIHMGEFHAWPFSLLALPLN